MFLDIFSQNYINSKSLSQFQIKRSFHFELILNMMNIAETFTNKNAVLKEKLLPLLDHLSAEENVSYSMLKSLKDKLIQFEAALIKKPPKLTNFIKQIESKLQDMDEEISDIKIVDPNYIVEIYEATLSGTDINLAANQQDETLNLATKSLMGMFQEEE